MPMVVGTTELDFSAGTVAIAANAATNGDRYVAEITLDQAGVQVPGARVAVDRLSAEARLSSRSDRPAAFEVTGGRLRSLARPALHVPIWLTANGSLGADGRLDFRAAGTGAGGALRLTARGQIAGSGDGEVSLIFAPVSLAPGVRTPADLFPVLAEGPVREAEGTVSARLAYGWGRQRRQWGRLDLVDLDLFTDVLVLEGVNGRLTASRFDPFVLPAGQRLSVDRIDVGLPLQQTTLEFGFRGPGRLAVSDLQAGLAGGRLSADPFIFELGGGDRRIRVRADGVDIPALVQLVDVPELEATGRLDGRIPLRLIDDTIRIEGSELEARSPGVIRYRGGDLGALAGGAGGGGVGLLAQAVQNFHYDTLRLGVDGEIGGEMTGQLRIRGSNPDLYDGYPIALTINLSGALSELLRQGLESGRVARRLQDYYEGRAGSAITDDWLDRLESIQE